MWHNNITKRRKSPAHSIKVITQNTNFTYKIPCLLADRNHLPSNRQQLWVLPWFRLFPTPSRLIYQAHAVRWAVRIAAPVELFPIGFSEARTTPLYRYPDINIWKCAWKNKNSHFIYKPKKPIGILFRWADEKSILFWSYLIISSNFFCIIFMRFETVLGVL